MADRTYNRIDLRIYDEDLSEGAIFMLVQIISRCPAACGVWDLQLGAIKRHIRGVVRYFADDRTDTMEERIDEALEELIEKGYIRMTPNNRVWIIRKWQHEPSNRMPNNRIGAIRTVAKVAPEFLHDFAEMYPVKGDWWQPGAVAEKYIREAEAEPVSDTGATEVEQRLNTGATEVEPKTDLQVPSVGATEVEPALDTGRTYSVSPDTDTDTDTEEEEERNVEGSPEAKVEWKPSTPAEHLADRICGQLDLAREKGFVVQNPRSRATIAKWIMDSGVDPSTIQQAWALAWKLDRGWRAKMLNMASLTKQFWGKLVNWYLTEQFDHRRKGQTLSEQAAEEGRLV